MSSRITVLCKRHDVTICWNFSSCLNNIYLLLLFDCRTVHSFYYCTSVYEITTTYSTLKLLFFSFSSCFTIERSIVFKTMDRQYESFSRMFSSATGLDKSFIFIRNSWTSSSIKENSEIFKKFQNFKKNLNFKNFIRFQNLKKNS
jgi:hypothetical protein